MCPDLPPAIEADVSRLVRVSVDGVVSALEEWRGQEPLAALALDFASSELDALCTSGVWGLTAGVRDAMWRKTPLPPEFWAAELWPVELPTRPISRGDSELCVRLAAQLQESGVDWPPPYVLNRAARALGVILRETGVVRLTSDFLVFTYPDPDPKFIEESATFAVGPDALRTWREAGCFVDANRPERWAR